MIVAAKEKKHHCRSGAKFIEKNGSMQAQTNIMYVSENGIERGSEESIHMAVAQRQCSCDLSSLLVPWPAWREVFRLSDGNSVCDSGVGFWRLRNFRCLAHAFLDKCQLGQQRPPKRGHCRGKENIRRGGSVLCWPQWRTSWKRERKDEETGVTERYGWSELNCMELADTSSVARDESQKILREAHNQEVIAASNDLAQWSRQEKKLGAKSGEMLDLASVHGQPRCCAPLREHRSSFPRYEKGSPGLERRGMVVRPQSFMRNCTVVFQGSSQIRCGELGCDTLPAEG